MVITHNHSGINFFREQFAIDVILGRLLWLVLGHEKFCLRLRSLLFIHCSCMLVEKRSINILIVRILLSK